MSIRAIERAAATAWPVSERMVLGEWVLNAGDGFSRRRNSTVPEGPAPADLERRLDDVAAWYSCRGLPILYRITPLCDPEVDRVLADLGYGREAPVAVMTGPIDQPDSVEGVEECPVATDAWVSTELGALGIDRSQAGPWLATIRTVPAPVSFATSWDDDVSIGAGFGVVADGLLGVFEVAVRPEYRRRGHARRIMAALHSFGLRQGAERAYLQVVEDNIPAVDLYRSLGYEISHRYWYRRAVL